MKLYTVSKGSVFQLINQFINSLAARGPDSS